MSLLEIKDDWSFICVAYIHYAGYLSGLLGLILAIVRVRPVIKPDTKIVRENGT